MERPVLPANFVVLGDEELQRIANSLNNAIAQVDAAIQEVDPVYRDDMIRARDEMQLQVTAIHLLM